MAELRLAVRDAETGGGGIPYAEGLEVDSILLKYAKKYRKLLAQGS
jgi:hypothetical protein